MRFLCVFVLAIFVLSSVSFGLANVSEKKEISIFPVFSANKDRDISSAVLSYFDSELTDILVGMVRFEVAQYSYYWDNLSVVSFINLVRELKKEALLHNPKYVDKDLGVVVIPAHEMERLVNAYFIIIPKIRHFYSTEAQITEIFTNITTKNEKKIVVIETNTFTEYKAKIDVAIDIITTEGELAECYLSESEATSRDSRRDANEKAISGSLSGLAYFLRNSEHFKLRTRILEKRDSSVVMELGRNMGIESGYEFVILRSGVDSGLVRVFDASPKISHAAILLGEPIIGDQLVESPKTGLRLGYFGGLATMSIPYSAVDLIIQSYDTNIGAVFTNRLDFQVSSLVPMLGVYLGFEIGYPLLFTLKAGGYVCEPYALFFDVILGYEFFFRNISLVPELGFSFLVSPISMKRMALHAPLHVPTSKDSLETITYYNNVDMSGLISSVGIKPQLSVNLQLNQHTKIKAFGGYAFYDNSATVTITGTGLETNQISTIAINATNTHISFSTPNGSSPIFPIDFGGFFFGIEVIHRF